MKPTPQFRFTSKHDDRFQSREGAAFPKTDFNFKANSLDDFGGSRGGKEFPSFRRIGDEFFQKEARRHFVTEAILFGLIVLTVAAPVYQAVRVFVKSVFGLL